MSGSASQNRPRSSLVQTPSFPQESPAAIARVALYARVSTLNNSAILKLLWNSFPRDRMGRVLLSVSEIRQTITAQTSLLRWFLCVQEGVDFGTTSDHKFKDAKLRVFCTAGGGWNRGFWHTRFGRGQNLFCHVYSLLPVILSELDNVANPRHFPDEDF